ncbi:hypothetical protein GCM10023335_31840 [Streptomyces siamensis]|uniref:Uncharacterized protein n=1 Tax=Streptomyces siamensis TaxID=1274986 RepID=A0ABP9IUU7_9ACTN
MVTLTMVSTTIKGWVGVNKPLSAGIWRRADGSGVRGPPAVSARPRCQSPARDGANAATTAPAAAAPAETQSAGPQPSTKDRAEP